MSESGDRMDTTDIAKVDPAPSHPEPGEVSLTVMATRVNEEEAQREVVFDVHDAGVFYGEFQALRDVSLPILKNQITALIGPSGCGKTTFIRCLNRMNDLIEGARGLVTERRHPPDVHTSITDPVDGDVVRAGAPHGVQATESGRGSRGSTSSALHIQ